MDERSLAKSENYKEKILDKGRGGITLAGKWSFLAANDYLRRVVGATFKLRQSTEKLSYRKAAKIVGCHHIQIFEYITGKNKRAMTDKDIIRLCEILKLKVSIHVDIEG